MLDTIFFAPQIASSFYMFVNRRYHLWKAFVLYKLENGTIASNWERKREEKYKMTVKSNCETFLFSLFSITFDIRLAFSMKYRKKNPFIPVDKKRPKLGEKKNSCHVLSTNLLIYEFSSIRSIHVRGYACESINF